MHFLVTSIFLYACESWILTAEFLRRMQAMEMRYYRKILHISYKDLDKASTAYDMEISAEKTELMTNNTSGINTEIKVN